MGLTASTRKRKSPDAMPKKAMTLDQLPMDITYMLFHLLSAADHSSLRLVSRKLNEICHQIHFYKIPYFCEPWETRAETLEVLDAIMGVFPGPHDDCTCLTLIRRRIKTQNLDRVLFPALVQLQKLGGRFVPFAAVKSVERWNVRSLSFGCSHGANCLKLGLDLKHVQKLAICEACALDTQLFGESVGEMSTLKSVEIRGPCPWNFDNDDDSDDDSDDGFEDDDAPLIQPFPFQKTPLLASFSATYCKFAPDFCLPTTLKNLQLSACSFRGGVRQQVMSMKFLRDVSVKHSSQRLSNCHGYMQPVCFLSTVACECMPPSKQTNDSIDWLHLEENSARIDLHAFKALRMLRFDLWAMTLDDVAEFLMGLDGHPTLDEVIIGIPSHYDLFQSIDELFEDLDVGFEVRCYSRDLLDDADADAEIDDD